LAAQEMPQVLVACDAPRLQTSLPFVGAAGQGALQLPPVPPQQAVVLFAGQVVPLKWNPSAQTYWQMKLPPEAAQLAEAEFGGAVVVQLTSVVPQAVVLLSTAQVEPLGWKPGLLQVKPQLLVACVPPGLQTSAPFAGAAGQAALQAPPVPPQQAMVLLGTQALLLRWKPSAQMNWQTKSWPEGTQFAAARFDCGPAALQLTSLVPQAVGVLSTTQSEPFLWNPERQVKPQLLAEGVAPVLQTSVPFAGEPGQTLQLPPVPPQQAVVLLATQMLPARWKPSLQVKPQLLVACVCPALQTSVALTGAAGHDALQAPPVPPQHAMVSFGSQDWLAEVKWKPSLQVTPQLLVACVAPALQTSLPFAGGLGQTLQLPPVPPQQLGVLFAAQALPTRLKPSAQVYWQTKFPPEGTQVALPRFEGGPTAVQLTSVVPQAAEVLSTSHPVPAALTWKPALQANLHWKLAKSGAVPTQAAAALAGAALQVRQALPQQAVVLLAAQTPFVSMWNPDAHCE
jgi:hypothetical protein